MINHHSTSELAIVGVRLARELETRRHRNPRYSLRALARDLGISAATLSEVIAGKRLPSAHVIKRLEHTGLFAADALASLRAKARGRRVENRGDWRTKSRRLPEPATTLLDGWHHFAILLLAETKGFRSDPAWISRQLGVGLAKVREALRRLEEVGLIAYDGKELVLTGNNLATTDEVARDEIQRAHQEYLKLAMLSLQRDPVECRDFVSVGMAIDPRRIPEAKEMVRRFSDKLMRFLEGGEPSAVYRMSFNLFPMHPQAKEEQQ